MIYLDNAATTKPLSSAIQKASVFNEENYFNPSALYRGGLNVSKEIKEAKEKILSFLGGFEHEVFFTSCGTESDNTAVFTSTKRGIAVTDKGEHSAIYKSFLELKNRGREIEFIDLNKDGSVKTEELFDFISKNKDVSFVSIVHVNNETGAINDINYIAKKIKEINKNIIFHSDGVQAYGKIPYKLSKDIDLYSVSAHKIGALKGTGAFIKKKNFNFEPFMFGGGQENGYRSGTENVFGIKVFQYASEERYKNLSLFYDKVNSFNKIIKDKLDKNLFTIISSDNASPYILTISAIGVRGEVIMHALEEKGIIIGNGSACSSKNRYSRVIGACGYDNNVLDGVIRISFSPYNTQEEILTAIECLNETVKKFKGIMR